MFVNQKKNWIMVRDVLGCKGSIIKIINGQEIFFNTQIKRVPNEGRKRGQNYR